MQQSPSRLLWPSRLSWMQTSRYLMWVRARIIALSQVLEDTSGMRHISDLPRTGLDSVLRVAASNVGLQEVPTRTRAAMT